MNDLNLFKTNGSLYFRQVSSKNQVLATDACDGYLISSSEKEARRIIDSLRGSGKKIAVCGGDNAFNRRALETLRIDFLVNPEMGRKRDTLKQRDSGLNHVLARIAANKGVRIACSVADLGGLSAYERAKRLSRIIQNIKICRKVDCPITLVNLASSTKQTVDVKSRQALGTSLGMSSQQAANCVRME